MDIDIAEILGKALSEVGVDAERLTGIAGCSTLCLEFESNRQLFVASMDGDVWLWTSLPRNITALTGNHVLLFLDMLGRPYEWARGHHLMFAQHEERSDVLALIHPEHVISGKRLVNAITEFMGSVNNICEVFRCLPIVREAPGLGGVVNGENDWMPC